jgi:hypothetical protein
MRYSEELIGMMMSPGSVGFGPPSPNSPWQGVQFFWNRVWPTSRDVPEAAVKV